MKKAIEFNKINLYKIFMKNQFDEFKKIKKLIYKKRLM